MVNNTRDRLEFGVALRDATPFAASLLLSFIMVGILAKKQGLNIIEVFFFSAAVMSAPLQWTLLQASPHSLDFYGVLITAVSINLRFFIFGLSLISSFDGPSRRFMPALAVMGNAAYTLMATRKNQKLTPVYATTVCFSLYFAALVGTVLGFAFANIALGFNEQRLTVVLAIFIAASLGKQAREKFIFPTQLVALVLSVSSYYFFKQISLNWILLAVILISYSYERE